MELQALGIDRFAIAGIFATEPINDSAGFFGIAFLIIEEKNKAYIDGFGYVAPSKTKTIIVDSDGDINKMVGSME